MPTSQPEGPLELMLAPSPIPSTSSALTSATEAPALISISEQPVPPLSASNASCGPDIRSTPPSSSPMVAIYGHKVLLVPSPSAPTTSVASLCGPNTELASSTSAPTAAARCGLNWIGNDAIDTQFIGSDHEPLPSSALLFKPGLALLVSTTTAVCHREFVAHDAKNTSAKGATN
jgi:hypothetical protein